MTKQYHFIGIGGIGMSALAKLVIREGASVSGSDQHDSPLLRQLERLGARVFVGHDASHVPPGATVVASDAVRGSNPELTAAQAAGQPVMRRSQLLGALMAGHQGIAVSGTHGKTTTTAMIARVLIDAGLDPTVMVGGEALGPGGNARLGHGPHFVAEACEAYGAFLDLSPTIAVITNIEPDHLDYHGGFEHILAAFRLFSERVRRDGLLVVNADDPEADLLARTHDGRMASYGLTAGEWRAVDIVGSGLESRFTVVHEGREIARIVLGVPGDHNVSNALAAFVVAVQAGVDPETAARALEAFRTVGRRFEALGVREGVEVVDDYAHHPTEVRATLRAARTAFEGRVIAVFQPHLFSRTRDFMNEFIAAFDEADVVVISSIYAAREEPIPGVDAAEMVEGILRRAPGKSVSLVELPDIPHHLARLVQPGDVVITMGAGDIRTAGEAFLALPVSSAAEVPA